jgi:hypothetical protein
MNISIFFEVKRRIIKVKEDIFPMYFCIYLYQKWRTLLFLPLMPLYLHMAIPIGPESSKYILFIFIHCSGNKGVLIDIGSRNNGFYR